MTHRIEELFEALGMVEPYPAGVVPVRARLPCTGFFPGGAGLWQSQSGDLPALPTRGTMILGHNLDSERGFAQSVARGGENLQGATWRALTEFLNRAIPGEQTLAWTIGAVHGHSRKLTAVMAVLSPAQALRASAFQLSR